LQATTREDAVVLKGEKVLLRSLEKEDLEAFNRFQNDFEIHQLADDEPYVPRPFAFRERWFDEKVVKNEETTSVFFAIEADEKLIGSCGLFDIDTTSRNAVVGIVIGNRDYWGKGYGRDALGVLIEYGFQHRNLHHIVLDVLATNERAVRSYLAVGFAEEGRLREHAWFDGRWVDMVSMGILRDEWVGRAQGTSKR
jgi:RimJ/RimL family protein N-acetyltransferase